MALRCGFVLPGGSAVDQLELAIAADAAGWDGVFVWEAAYGVDAWSLLSAMAVRTERTMLGTMLTPLPWRRPWKVASQAATLQELSGGRAIVAVGLGAVDTELGTTGEETDRRTRAAQLDEGIDLMRTLWRGDPVFEGDIYRVDLSARASLGMGVEPVTPAPKLWVVGAWPRPKSMRRALRTDGVLPTEVTDGGGRLPEPEAVGELCRWLADNGPVPDDYDVVVEGETDPVTGEHLDRVGAYERAGATWWLEAAWGMSGDPGEKKAALLRRIEAGPPRP